MKMDNPVKKPPITLTLCVVNNEQLSVVGENTAFIMHKHIPLVDLTKLKKVYLQITRLAKEKNLKVYHRNGLKKQLDDLMVPYPIARREYDARYALLRLALAAKIEQGLYHDFELDGILLLRDSIEELSRSKNAVQQAYNLELQLKEKLLYLDQSKALIL